MKWSGKTLGLAAAISCSAFVFNAPAQADKPQSGSVRSIDYKADISYSFGSRLWRGQRELGNMDTLNNQVNVALKFRATDKYSWWIGPEWERFSYSLPSGAQVPGTLQSLALGFGNQWNFRDNWSVRFFASPGVFSDFRDVNWLDFNAPLGLIFSYSSNPDLTWVFGVRGDFRSEFPILPLAGARWKFADRWTLSLLAPKPQVEYQLNDNLTLFAGGEYKGGAFRVGEKFGNETGAPALNNEWVNYREFRIGAGFTYAFTKTFSAVMDSGWMIDRRFLYPKQDLMLNGDGAPYVQLGLKGSF